MIHIDDSDVVARLATDDGRFVLFTRTDLPGKHPLPWTGAMFDTGGDGFGVSVRLLQEDVSWSPCDLLRVVLARTQAEEQRRLGPLVVDAQHHLGLALAAEYRRLGSEPADTLRFSPGPLPSPYPWTVVWRGSHCLPLCPDPASRDEGITPEQVLMVLIQAFSDAVVPVAQRQELTIARDHAQRALESERRRVQRLRQMP